jgi:hypothetical protein
MDIQWPSYDDDDGLCFDDDDPGDLYQFTPDEIHTSTQRPLNDHATKCGILVQVETDPRRVQYLEQALIDGLSSGPSLCSKDSPPSSFRVLPEKVMRLILGAVVLCFVLPGAQNNRRSQSRIIAEPTLPSTHLPHLCARR